MAKRHREGEGSLTRGMGVVGVVTPMVGARTITGDMAMEEAIPETTVVSEGRGRLEPTPTNIYCVFNFSPKGMTILAMTTCVAILGGAGPMTGAKAAPLRPATTKAPIRKLYSR